MSETEPPSDPDALHDEDTRTRIERLRRRVGDVSKDAATTKETADDHERRLRAVEAWPQRIIFTVITGAVGMIVTVAGFGWSLSAQLARMEARLDSAAESDERRDTRIDRLEDRTDQTYTRSHGGE